MQTENLSISLEDSKALAECVVAVLLEKGARDVKLFFVRDSSSVTDYYINATGRSSTNVMALADEVLYKVGLLGREAHHTEGRDGRSWILVDYGDVILNVFDRESREFYNLDRLLNAENEIDISHIVAEVDAKFDINKN